MNRIIKKSLAFLLAFGMIFGQSAGMGVQQVYASDNNSQNISSQNDCLDGEKLNILISELSTEDNLNITSNTTLQLNENSVYKYNNITISEGVKLTISGNGTLYATSVIGGQIAITGGNIYADTLQSKYGGLTISGGEVTANIISSGNATYDNPQGADLKISGGKVTVYKELLGGSSYYSQNCNGGNVYISNGEVNVYGIIQAGSGSGAPNSYYGGSGGNVKIYSNAKVYVEGTIQGGTGAKRGIFATYADRDKDSSRGGYVYIYSDTTVIGTVAGGSGGDGYSWDLCNGGHGGNVYIYGGNITGKIIGGKGGAGYNGYRDFAKGGNSGSVYFYGGIINAVDGIFVDNYGTGKYQGNYGTMYSSEDSQVYITASILPSREKFLSGIINCNGNMDVYGTQNLVSDQIIESNNILTIKDSASLTISGSDLTVDGELKNNGSVIINDDADLTGSGVVIYDNETISISEIKELLVPGIITIPSGLVYDGNDHSGSIAIVPNSVYGIQFMQMDLSDYDSSLSYSKTSDGKKSSTDTAKNAGYYTVSVTNSSGALVVSKDFQITQKELSVKSVMLGESGEEIGLINFDGLVDGDSLVFGTDYTVDNSVIRDNEVTGVITLLDTPAAQNYSVSNSGSFTCTEIMENHEHNMEWKSDENGHWKECSCGEKGTVYPHGNDEDYTGVITVEATEEHDGERTFYCKDCGYAYRIETVKYEHIHAAYGDWVTSDSYHWHICKCGEEGIVFDKAMHTPDEGTVIVEATETDEGLIRYCCKVCGKFISEVTIPVITTHDGQCGDELYWDCDNGTLIISGSGEMYDYSFESKAPWYQYNTDITEVVVQNGAENIGSYAFYKLSALTKVTLPSTLNSIGSNAFSNCGQLKEITVPDNVSTIGYAAFSNCTKLEKIDLPAELKSIGSSMFDKCYALKTVQIPEKVTSIGLMAFNYCTALTSVEIPDSVTEIGTNAFSQCGNLKHIHIPCGKTASDYSGQGGLPANSEYYFILDSNGNCPNGNCPMDTSSTVEVIMGVTVNSDKVVVKYGSGNSVTRTVSYSFDQVSEDIVDYMADTDIKLIIEFVNAFTALDNDCFELTAAQLMAVERVLSNDYAA